MMITLAGAMSTAELGISLAEMIRQDKVHAITCTGANLEEDLFNLVARSQYERIPHYRELTGQQEEELLQRHLNRVTDTCIPEEEAMRRIEHVVLDEWASASKKKERRFPHEFFYKILRECRLKKFYEIDPADSWMVAAAHKDLPIFVTWLGGFDIGKYLCCTLHYGCDCRCAYDSLRHRIYDRAGGLVSPNITEFVHWFLPDRRRHSRRFSDLRRAHAKSRRGNSPCSGVGLFLSDQRLHN